MIEDFLTIEQEETIIACGSVSYHTVSKAYVMSKNVAKQTFFYLFNSISDSV